MARSRSLFMEVSGVWVFLLAAFILPLLFCTLNSPLTHAEATQSTLTMQVNPHLLTIDITPFTDGDFEHSSNATIAVSTDNYTGYRLSVVSDSTRNLVSKNNNTIPTLESAVSESVFSSSSTYNNRWGYKPSQYIVIENGVNSTVMNTEYYLPAPTVGTGDLIDLTSAANSTSNTYTLSFGARVDGSQPAGEYTYDYVIVAVANTIVYNITYDANISGAVGSMPSPNPQALNVAGGTSSMESYSKLSSAVPTLADRTFGGWCDVVTTINSNTGNYECSGIIYKAGDDYPIDQTSSNTNITLYAIWLVDPFPVAWSQMGKCIFDGKEDTNNGYISGPECTDYSSDKYIDTGVALYSTTNYSKDYEVHFTIDRYVYNE